MDYMEIHNKAIVVDGHSDIPLHLLDTRGNNKPSGIFKSYHLPLLKKGGVNIVFGNLFERLHPEGSLKEAMIEISDLYNELDESDETVIIKTKKDLKDVVENNKIGIVLSMEGMEPIGNEICLLRSFYELGIRSGMLTWNYRNYLAAGTLEIGGLSNMGKEAVKEMERLGMIVDVSHLNEEGFWDIMKIAKKPVIASHSNAKTVYAHVRNLTDEQIKAIAQTGGVVGLNSYFTGDSGEETLQGYMKHLEYMIEVAGEDHVGLGFDFNSYLGSDGAKGLEDCTCIPNVTKELVNLGYKEATIYKILGGNFMRVLENILP